MKTTSEEIRLFNHDEYGEGFLAMAYHVKDMSQLDRMIFEDCMVVDGAVVAPHVNAKSRCSLHLRPEIISRNVGCSFQQAVALADAWSIIEVSPKMVDVFTGWIKAKGIEKGLAYFEGLARRLAEVEVCWDHEPVGNDKDEACDDHVAEYDESVPDLYGYHAIGHDDIAFLEEKTWEQKQPDWYLSILFKVRDVSDLKSLKVLARYAFQFDLSRGQAGVFWYEYRKAKDRIMKEVRRALRLSAKGLLKQIRNANGHLPAVGALLYKIQQGKVKMNNPPSDPEWSILWDAYHEQQQARDQNS